MKFFSRLAIIGFLTMILILSFSAVAAQDDSIICSKSSDISTFVVITNGTQQQLKYYWIDENCKQHEYGTIDPGKTAVQPTYATHAWIVGTAVTGNRVGEILVPQSAEPLVAEMACSLMSNVPLNFTVVNQSSSTANLYWVDELCNEIPYATLEAGQSLVQPTYQGHVWVLRDAQTGKLLTRTRANALVAPAAS